MKKVFVLLCVSLMMISCSEKPDTLVSEYDQNEMDNAILKAQTSVDTFIGILDKGEADSFSVKAPITDENGTEHFWISDIRYENGVFTGFIGNEPGVVSCVRYGQEWSVKKEKISDWMYTIDDKIYGGFTIDPLLSSYPKEQADSLRARLVR